MSRAILNEVPALLSGERWQQAKATNLSFSFPDSVSDYGYSGFQNVRAGYAPLTLALADSLRAGLQAYADVSGLRLTEWTGARDRDADLKFARSSVPETAFSYFPSILEPGGDAWFNKKDFNSPVTGDYAWSTLLHELGHSFGLKHAHEPESNSSAVLSRAYDSHEFTLMTYHSFIGAAEFFGDREPLYTNDDDSGPQSLMMLDVAAIQDLYGANFGFRSSDTVYRFSPSTGRMLVNGVVQEQMAGNIVFRTIWDGGGTDTYNFSDYTRDLDIDLAAGGFVDLDVNGNHQRAHLGGSAYARGHVFNALQYEGNTASLIENAIGGVGNDRLRGNQAANVLEGRNGNDRLEGLQGNDTLIGGAGADTFVFNLAQSRSGDTNTVADLNFSQGDRIVLSGLGEGVLADSFLYGNKLDVLNHGDGASIDSLADLNEIARSDIVDAMRTPDGAVALAFDLMGGLTIQLAATRWTSLTSAHGYSANAPEFGAVNEVLWAKGSPISGGIGDDTMFGSAGDDVMRGGAGKDVLSGGKGADKLFGGKGADKISGGKGNDTLKGGGGPDEISGGGGGDILVGAGGDDTILGGQGRDTLSGRGGADWLEGGRGNDLLRGGAGKDRFVFNAKDGADRIFDFQQGLDKIVIEAGAKSFRDLHFRDVGDDVVIEFAQTKIRVDDAEVQQFGANDFLF